MTGRLLLVGAIAGALGTTAACARSSSAETDADDVNAPTLALHGVTISESDALARPTYLGVVGRHVAVVDAAGDPAVHLVDPAADGDGLVGSFGRAGEGPGEFRAADAIDPVPGSDGRFWVFDVSLGRSTEVDIARDLGDSSRLGSRIYRFEGSLLPMRPVRLGDSVTVSPTIYGDRRLVFFDADGKPVRTAGALPVAPDETMPANVLQHAYTGNLAANPDRTRLALATRHADRLEIYNASGELLAHAERPHGFEPVFEVGVANGNSFMASGDAMRFGYVDVAATNEHIYALFSGRRRGEWPGRATFADKVYVFDWQGHLQRVLELGSDVLTIAVDPEGEALYAARRDPLPAILRFDLPETDGSSAAAP